MKEGRKKKKTKKEGKKERKKKERKKERKKEKKERKKLFHWSSPPTTAHRNFIVRSGPLPPSL